MYLIDENQENFSINPLILIVWARNNQEIVCHSEIKSSVKRGNYYGQILVKVYRFYFICLLKSFHQLQNFLPLIADLRLSTYV